MTAKRALTTGEIAKFCGVNFRTVIRWIQRGQLEAFQLPGRGDNRVIVEDFLAFLREHEMPVPPELGPSAMGVVICDGDPRVARSMKRALQKENVSSTVIEGAVATALAITAAPPAVLVLDPTGPGWGGIDAIERLRSDARTSTIGILVVGGLSAEELDRAMEAGADAVLPKPFDRHDLTAIVQRLLDGSAGG